MIGNVFYETIADGNARFEVVSREARGIYKCVAKDNPGGDYDGTTRLKSKAELDSIINSQKVWDDLDKEAERYVASLSVGDIVHYSHGFGIFIQCEVVRSDEHGHDEWAKYGVALKQIALLGNARQHDLPSVRHGQVYIPHLSSMVVNSEVFTPHPSNLYENKPDGKYDPYKMGKVNIEIPQLTEADKRVADIHQAFKDAMEFMGEPSEDNLEAVLVILQGVKRE